MRLPRPTRVRAASGALEVLEERARQLAQAEVAEGEQEHALIRFRLEGVAYAVEMSAVDRVVSRLGEVEGIAGAPGRVRGVAFIDNVPHAVVELAHALGGAPRPLDALAESPALILSRSDGALALTVDGPLEMQEVAGLMLAQHTVERRDNIEVTARLEDGALVVSRDWLKRFLIALGQGT
jgi:chemotaxis signal transduction protein